MATEATNDSRATQWSDWTLDEQRGERYCYRLNENGDTELLYESQVQGSQGPAPGPSTPRTVPSGGYGNFNQNSTSPQNYTYEEPADEAQVEPQRRLKTQDNEASTEPLNKDFKRLKPKDTQKFFIPGRVFSILWTEPTSAKDTKDPPMSDAFSIVKYNETVYTEIRRFIVIKTFQLHSLCVPIATYRKYGTLNRPDAEHHSIAFSGPTPPDPLPGEALTKYAIKINTKSKETSLEVQSRINFSKIYTVEHNVKVNQVGEVDEQYLQYVLLYCRQSAGVQ